MYKLLSSLLVQRLTPYLDANNALPDEQHGFRAYRSTMTACATLLDKIDQTASKKGQLLYAVFVDFRAAFDSGSRRLVLERLAVLGIPTNVLGLLKDILQSNPVTIDDNVVLREGLHQTNGFAQGDNLSPLLFSLLIADLLVRIRARHPFVNVTLYADDLVIFSTSRFDVQQALATLNARVLEIGLEINMRETEAMKFRRGGNKLAESDTLRIGGQDIKYVNQFTYLGFTLTTTGQSFAAHVQGRCRKALVMGNTINKPRELSLTTALALFDIGTVGPTASYGIPN